MTVYIMSLHERTLAAQSESVFPMHLALYTIYYYMHIIHIIYAMRLCVCRRIIEN